MRTGLCVAPEVARSHGCGLCERRRDGKTGQVKIGVMQFHETLQKKAAPRVWRDADLFIYRSLWPRCRPRSRLLEAVRSLSLSALEAPAPTAELVSPRPAVAPPAAKLEDVSLLAPAEDAPVPSAVLVEPLPAVAPPTPKLDEVPAFDPDPADDAPVPNAALALPSLALAAPTPNEEPVPAVPVEEPPVPTAVLALPLPVVDAPEPTVEALCAWAIGAMAIAATIAAADINAFLWTMMFAP